MDVRAPACLPYMRMLLNSPTLLMGSAGTGFRLGLQVEAQSMYILFVVPTSQRLGWKAGCVAVLGSVARFVAPTQQSYAT